MIKRLLMLSLAFLSVMTASAQLMYNFKDTTTPYAPLTSGTSMNGSLIWDDDLFYVQMPFTWKLNGSINTNYFFMATFIPGAIADTNDFTNVDCFILSDADVADRGGLTGSATLSPIRYTTAGVAPNRIFKVEMANAGFYVEYDSHSTMNDFTNTQIWVYEGSNIVEFHFGPSQITYPTEYYGFGGAGPMTGYGRGIDMENGTSGNIYYLTGSASAPTLDSFSLPLSTPPTTLSAWPADGKVYRFTPKVNSVGVPNTSTGNHPDILVYPTVATAYLNVLLPALRNESAEYQIYSIAGTLVGSGSLQAVRQRIDISTLASGSYYLQIKAGEARGNYRFIKQ